MTLETTLARDLETLDPEDLLSCITADLLEYDRNSPFLVRLFAQKSGEWSAIEPLCANLPDIETQLHALSAISSAQLRVTWLSYPAATGSGFCLILFFAEALHWDNLALYNQALFLKRHAVPDCHV
ncbi:hypothetical protein AB3R30_23420 [Leptolyngbyaceae cyanobacterium UHCC 1019]